MAVWLPCAIVGSPGRGAPEGDEEADNKCHSLVRKGVLPVGFEVVSYANFQHESQGTGHQGEGQRPGHGRAKQLKEQRQAIVFFRVFDHSLSIQGIMERAVCSGRGRSVGTRSAGLFGCPFRAQRQSNGGTSNGPNAQISFSA